MLKISKLGKAATTGLEEAFDTLTIDGHENLKSREMYASILKSIFQYANCYEPGAEYDSVKMKKALKLLRKRIDASKDLLLELRQVKRGFENSKQFWLSPIHNSFTKILSGLLERYTNK